MLAATVAWQAAVDELIVSLIGLPLGILWGRELWILFARDINAVPQPTVPVTATLVMGMGTVVAAIIAALWPGRSGAATPVRLVLRTE